MKKIIIIIISIFSILNISFSQTFTISGTISDSQTGEDLIGANVTVKGKTGVGTVANTYGFYSLSLKSGEYTFIYSFIGYNSQEFTVKLDKNIKKNFELEPETNELEEVVISGVKSDANIKSIEMGVENIDMKEIDQIPVMFGEKDVLKTIQLLPGVKSAGEGSSGFYVRGGGSDQNLILLDEAPVYNASHLLGFFSVFNSDALRDVKLYKGYIPAEYGGRLSSVMDIKMKEGNLKKFAVSGGIGLIASKLTLEGPIVKDKGSFIVSGRRTYADIFLNFSKKDLLKESTLYFYDFNAKANYKISQKDRIYLSGYFGRDIFGYADQFGFDWGNATGTARWNHIINEKIFSNTSLIFSNYNYKIKFEADSFNIQIGSLIQDFNLKQDFDFYINEKNTMKIGANVIHHNFKPGDVETDSEEFEEFLSKIATENSYSYESVVYFSNEQKITKNISATYGVRYSNFTQIGPGNIYTFNHEGNVTDTTTYKKNEKIISYNGLDPRVALVFVINGKSSLKTAYSRTHQYLHLLSNTTASSPTDVWIPSSKNVVPQISDQISFGFFRNFFDNSYEFSTEIYYKWMQNVIDYKVGAEVTLNPIVEGELLYGIGRAYGAEFFLKKRTGDFIGWISYTLSKTERQFAEINKGKWFSAKQDIVHDISIVLMYNITDRLNVSTSWVYYTGSAVTFPTGKFELDGNTYYNYTERNGFRMPNYHRLDIGVTLANKDYKFELDAETGEQTKVKKKYNSSWNFSVYNAYLRENAYSISFRNSTTNPGQTEAVQLALFKIIPSISYNFNF